MRPRHLIATAAIAAAALLVAAAPAGAQGPSKLETKLGRATHAIVSCDPGTRGSQFTLLGKRPAIQLEPILCRALNQSIRTERAAHAAVVAGWQTLSRDAAKVMCYRHERANGTQATDAFAGCDQESGFAQAVSPALVGGIMRRAGIASRGYIRLIEQRVERSVLT